jgi:hypothetical protein
MKKTLNVFTTVMILALITVGTQSFTTKRPEVANEIHHTGITYVVTVDHPNGTGMCHSYLVVISDEEGNPIDAPIPYHEGIDNYIFHENGPVTGTRTAHLQRIHSSGQHHCSQVMITPPDQITGCFRNGSTYLFSLHPQVVPGDD